MTHLMRLLSSPGPNCPACPHNALPVGSRGSPHPTRDQCSPILVVPPSLRTEPPWGPLLTWLGRSRSAPTHPAALQRPRWALQPSLLPEPLNIVHICPEPNTDPQRGRVKRRFVVWERAGECLGTLDEDYCRVHAPEPEGEVTWIPGLLKL